MYFFMERGLYTSTGLVDIPCCNAPIIVMHTYRRLHNRWVFVSRAGASKSIEHHCECGLVMDALNYRCGVALHHLLE